MIDWRKWIGLPHKIGADPRNGEAACCLIMAKIILEDAGIKLPVDENKMISLAEKKLWPTLSLVFEKKTEFIEKPEPYAVSLINNPTQGLGVGVVVEEAGNLYLLMPHHRRGVQAFPVRMLRPEFTFFKVVQ
jgi:hypothetical protein